jgi:hypothetical protein
MPKPSKTTKTAAESDQSDFPIILKRIYRRVADVLDVTPSYVSRVARGERRSAAVEFAIDRESRKIIRMLRAKQHNFGSQATGHNASRRKDANPRAVKKKPA